MVTLPPLWSHQQKAIEIAGNKFGLFFDPGTGKTRTLLEIYKAKRPHRQYVEKGKAIIFAPIGVCRNWPIELEKYFDLPYKVFLVAGSKNASKEKRLSVIQKFKDCTEDKHCFLICNIECLRSEDFTNLLATSGATFMAVDESHNLKGYKSKQTLGMFRVTERARPTHLYLLTGTPAPQGYQDLWSTLVLMGLTKDTFYTWQKKHFTDKNERRRGTSGYYPDYVISEKSKQFLQQQLAARSLTAKKSEVLDLPELLRVNVYSEMSKEQARYYDTMKEYLFAIDAEGNELNAANLLTRTLRLQQILAGFLGVVPVKDNPRLDALDTAIEMIPANEQFIIWTIFKPTYHQIAERLEKKHKVSYRMLVGDVSPEDRAENVAAFQAGEVRCIIANPKVGGEGINLNAASYSIYYTKNFDLTDNIQAEARNHRGGSERHKSITRIDIVTPDTIDEQINKALAEKKSVMDFIMGLKQNKNAIEMRGLEEEAMSDIMGML